MRVSDSPRISPLNRVISIVSGIALAIMLVALGFIACAAFDTPTRVLSEAFSDSSDSPYTQEELTVAAIATKHYTIDDNDRYALYTSMDAVFESAELDGRDLPDNIDLSEIYLQTDSDSDVATSDDSDSEIEPYVLTSDALSHLDDVYHVIQTVKPILCTVAVVAYVGCIALAFRCGLRTLGKVFTAAGASVLALFILLALWVALDFDGFFTAFHSLFFAAGTWTFSSDSLLICMYPTQFWIGMGVIWLIVTVIACLVCLIIGRSLRRPRKRMQQAEAMA